MRTATRLYRKVDPLRPLGPRPSIDPNPRIAEQITQGKMHVARFGCTVAIHDNVLLRCDPLRVVGTAQLSRLFPDVPESLLSEIVLPIVIYGSWYVPPTHLGACFSGKLVGWPGINQKRVVL